MHNATTQPLTAISGTGLRAAVGRLLDGVAPRVEKRAVLVKMGPGRPSFVGDHTRGNHITRAFPLPR